MTHIRSRDDIMRFLEEHAPRPSIARAMQEGKAELLGVFRHVSPCRTMGWIVEVTTKHNVTWHVAIKPTQFTRDFVCHVVGRVPWEHWMGDVNREGTDPLDLWNPMCAGDNPEKYRRLKDAKTKE